MPSERKNNLLGTRFRNLLPVVIDLETSGINPAVNDIAAKISLYQTNGIFASQGTYDHQVGGIAAYGDVNSGPFTFGVRYTTALTRFNFQDLGNVFYNAAASRGAKPWAADLTAGYGFGMCNVNNDLYLSYQASGDAVNLLIPKNRWLLGYAVEPWRNTSLGIELARDKDYAVRYGATGKTTGTVGARAAVRFG